MASKWRGKVDSNDKGEMKLRNNVSAILRIKNEEYWISYVIEALLKGGFDIFVGDTGSTDNTPDIVRGYCPDVHFYDFKGVPIERYGKIWEFLGHEAKTPYVMAIGDEIFTPEGLETVLDAEMGDHTGAWFDVQNIIWTNGFHFSSKWSKRKIFPRDATWIRTILQENVKGTENKEKWFYIKPGIPLAYHMRYTKRSSKDGDAYGRERKYLCHGEPPVGDAIKFFDIIGEPKFYNYYWNIMCRWRLDARWKEACKDPEHMTWLRKWKANEKLRGQ